MNTAMLWFDDDPKSTLEGKVRRAADYFRKKYGRDPEVCMVSSAMPEASGLETVDEIVLCTATNIQPNYFWIGVDD